jgi:cytoskeletal protein CcmA (bactofilin family)/ribosomal protein S27E
MPAKKQDQVLVACPHCGHQQSEPRSAYSTRCKKCGQHLRVQEILKPTPQAPRRAPQRRQVTCFECGAELEVPASAESTMCKKCSRYVDLHDYRITSSIAKNFKTKGVFVVEPKGCVFNTESIVGEAIIRGKFHGKLAVERSLTIYSTADLKGSLTATHLIIPGENHFRWPDVLKVGSAEIAGELAATLRARDGVVLKATARFFGDVDARSLTVEEGAVVVGKMHVGPRTGNEQSKLL